MNSKGSLRAHVCLTATTALFAGTAWGQASASQTHTIKHGETVESVSRQFHVALVDILGANHLAANDILRDGRKLIIPDSPKPVIVPKSMHRTARIQGDRISVRIGPGSAQRRLSVCDNGTKVVVTAVQDDWLQVRLADGRTGWVRSDFVHVSGGKLPKNQARNTPRRKRDDNAPETPAALVSDSERSRIAKARSGRTDRITRKHHEELHPVREAAAKVQHHSGESASARLHKHELALAHARHDKHVHEAAAAKQRARLAHEAAHRHNQEVAAAKRRHKHLAEAAAEQKHSSHHSKRAAEIAEARHRMHIEAAEAHRRQHEENIAHARKLRHLHELAVAKHHHSHSGEAVVHKRSHHDNEALANALRRKEQALARAHRHKNEALANYLHREQLKLAKRRHHEANQEATAHKHSRHANEVLANYLHRQELKLAKRHHSEAQHETVAHRRSRHENEALANYLHRQQVKLERHRNRVLHASATRHEESTHYSHRIRPEAESPSASNDVVRSAFAYRGTPYRWGMSRPGGFDCSGFTKYIYARKGVSLPRTAAEQYHAGRAVGHKNMKPGDLVFFHTTRSGISHVGMYVGSGKFVHSSSSKSGGVRVDNLDSGYYSKAFRGARRVQKETPNEASGE